MSNNIKNKIATKILQALQKIPGFTRLFFELSHRLGKNSRDTKWKSQWINAVQNVAWKKWPCKALNVEVGGVNIQLVPHAGEFDLSATVFNKLPYETELYDYLSRAQQKYDVIFDIGANVGLFSLAMNKMFPQAKIFSFEPSLAVWSRLVSNIEANNSPKMISLFSNAIAGEGQFLDFYCPKGHLTNGSLIQSFAQHFDSKATSQKVYAIPAKTLTSLLRPHEKVLIKIDVEGAEAMVLEDLLPNVGNKRVDLIVEVLSGFEEEIISVLRDNKYDYKKIVKEGLVETNDKGDDQFRDWFCTKIDD